MEEVKTPAVEERLATAVFKPREKRYQLKTLEGGYVVIQRLSYGARLERIQLASSLKTTIKASGNQSGEIPAEIASAIKATTYLDYKMCVVDHNLGNQVGRKLDFNNSADVDALDPAVGDEISQLIDEHNAALAEDDQGK